VSDETTNDPWQLGLSEKENSLQCWFTATVLCFPSVSQGEYIHHPPALGFFLPVAVVATSGVYNTGETHLKNIQ